MNLKINKACDLNSISILPPRRPQGSGGGGTSASASAAAAAAASRIQSMAHQSFSQGGASFSQGICGGSGGGGAAFSQGGGGGGAAFSQGGGGGGAAFSQGGGGGGAAFSQGGGGGGDGGGAAFSQGGHSPARHQRFALHDLSKRISSFPANSASCVREESQRPQAKTPTNPVHRWNHGLPDSKCQVNEDVERKFQHVASSLRKMGMVLDSVQDDVLQLNRAMKEASVDSGSMQKKFVLIENTLQQILKGQDDLKETLLGSTKSNPDQMSVLRSQTSRLDEISSTLSVLKQVQEELKQLKGDIFRTLTKEMEVLFCSLLKDKSCTSNTNLLMNQTPVANQSPIMNQRPVADGISKMNQVPEANEKPLMKQIAATKEIPAVCGRKVENVKPMVDQGVNAGVQKVVGSSCCMVAPKQKKVDPQAPTKKAPLSTINLDEEDDSDGSASCVMLKREPGSVNDLSAGLPLLGRACPEDTSYHY